MDRQYIVSPSVVEADKESEIVISAFSGQFGFYDDITYKVQFVPKEEYDIENPKELKLLYVHFLLRNYYPIHNDICFAQGDMMLDYIEGDTGVKDMIEKQELRLKRFNRSFFGE